MMNLTLALSLTGAVLCAAHSLSVRNLLPAAIWLACASAFTAAALYTLGGHVAAVMELSVGAGLVTVLFVFAIDLVGDAPRRLRSAAPRWLAGGLVLFIALTLGALTLPGLGPATAPVTETFAQVFWGERALDTMLQLVLLFSGAMTVTGLLVERRAAPKARAAQPQPPQPAPLSAPEEARP